MHRPLFLPTFRQIAWLAAITLAALAYAFYLRHQVIEQAAVGIGCESGLRSWTCASRRTAIMLYTPSVFGLVALGAALLNLVRPSVMFWAVGLAAAGLGLVLYNAALSALAAGLLILSLARPAPEPD